MFKIFYWSKGSYNALISRYRHLKNYFRSCQNYPPFSPFLTMKCITKNLSKYKNAENQEFKRLTMIILKHFLYTN